MYRNDLYRFCLYMARDRDAAADLFQDTWLKALKNIGCYDCQQDFKKWLFAVAANLQRDRWRRLKRWSALFQGVQPGLAASPEEVTQHRQDAELLYQCLGALPEKQRLAIVIHYIEGFSQEEVAVVLHVPVGTVKSRLHHGRKRLKKMMEVASHG